MEKKIREYERFIEKRTRADLPSAERAKLAAYHREMLANFQHERLVHLVVTLFFALLLVVALSATAGLVCAYGLAVELIPLWVLTAILAVLVGFYVKHYYFLENHVQKLYRYTKLLMVFD